MKTVGHIVLAVFIVIFAMALSWIVSCGIIKLITLCFGLEFSWAIATGIWLVLVLVGNFLRSKASK